MSASIPPKPPVAVSEPHLVPAAKDAPALEPLISTSPANQSTAAASAGGATGIVIILLWICGLFKIVVPPEVAAAFVSIIGAGVHWAVVTYSKPTTATS